MSGSLPPSPRLSWASRQDTPDLNSNSGQDAHEPAEPTAASWARRAQNRLDELRRFFALPDGETLIDEYHCALRKRILLQVGNAPEQSLFAMAALVAALVAALAALACCPCAPIGLAWPGLAWPGGLACSRSVPSQ
jgi:hypothetical protein